jgi:hypothetical protein
VGLFLDTRPAAVVDYPFAAADLHAGQSVIGQIEWRQVPARLLPGWDGEVAGSSVTDVAAGTPLLPELVTTSSVPKGWWSVALVLPHAVGPGTSIRVSLGGKIVTGVLSGEVVDTGYEHVGPVAFAADDAALVADAAADGTVVVMIGSPSADPTSAG